MNMKKPQPGKRSELEDDVDFERRQYVREWEVSSSHLAETGCYAWMADKFGGSGLLLEVGCGTGQSTLELVRRGNQVVAVEENPACLRRAKLAIEAAGYRVKALTRGLFRPLGPTSHTTLYEEVRKVKLPELDVVLIEGNIFDDPRLVAFLRSTGPFDGVVCWLIGTHGGMRMNKAVSATEVQTPADYRLLVQNTVYELADDLLKTDGVLHIVDRGQSVDEVVLEETLQGHKHQASVTSLEVVEIDLRPYEESATGGAMRVGTATSDGRMDVTTERSTLSLTSVRSVKKVREFAQHGSTDQ